MTYHFDATHLFAEDDGHMVMIGLADDELEPSKFVILQKAHEYGDQDKQLGMDKIYIQVEDESRSKYGGINGVQVKNGTIRILLSDEAKSALSIDGDIEVTASSEHPNFEVVKAYLQKMCEAAKISFTS